MAAVDQLHSRIVKQVCMMQPAFSGKNVNRTWETALKLAPKYDLVTDTCKQPLCLDYDRYGYAIQCNKCNVYDDIALCYAYEILETMSKEDKVHDKHTEQQATEDATREGSEEQEPLPQHA